jgi:hypothetical protein
MIQPWLFPADPSSPCLKSGLPDGRLITLTVSESDIEKNNGLTEAEE